jgi:hypothetical protein
MNMAVKPVPAGRGRRRRWSADQKLTVQQEWHTGVPLEAIGRKYAVNAAHMYHTGRAASIRGSRSQANWGGRPWRRTW